MGYWAVAFLLVTAAIAAGLLCRANLRTPSPAGARKEGDTRLPTDDTKNRRLNWTIWTQAAARLSGSDANLLRAAVMIGLAGPAVVGLIATSYRPDAAATQPISLPSLGADASAMLKQLQMVFDKDGQVPAGAAVQPATADIDEMIAALEERLQDTPQDINGWRILAWSYDSAGRFAQAVSAYRKAVDLEGNDPRLTALFGEALVKAAGGLVTDEALGVFDTVLAAAPNDERARFFIGLALAQAGNPKAAIDSWTELLGIAPQGAEWAADLRDMITSMARQAGIDIAGALPESSPAVVFTKGSGAQAGSSSNAIDQTPVQRTPVQQTARPNGPSAEDIENARLLTPDARNDMARGMVDNLASRLLKAPNDPDGWIMLMQSRLVLNEPHKARAALEQANRVFAEKQDILSRIKQAAAKMGLSAE